MKTKYSKTHRFTIDVDTNRTRDGAWLDLLCIFCNRKPDGLFVNLRKHPTRKPVK